MSEEEKFFLFVNEQITKLKKYTEMQNEDLKFSDLNYYLRNFEQILFSLIGLETTAEIEYKKEKQKFEIWYAERYMVIRQRENKPDLVAAKWIGAKEIEIMVMVENKREYSYMNENLMVCESKVEFIRNLKEGWNVQSFILNTLSKNVQTEVLAAIKSTNT